MLGMSLKDRPQRKNSWMDPGALSPQATCLGIDLAGTGLVRSGASANRQDSCAIRLGGGE